TLMVSAYPGSTTAGDSHNFTVTARDAFGNNATAFSGTVVLSSSDSHAVLSAATYTFTGIGGDNGVHTFSATLKTAGTQSITATDAGDALTGSQTGIIVTP